jgi:hypothetical protein
VVEAAIDTMTTKYTIKVANMAQSVPFGMVVLGFFKSPDMDAPAKMPDVALAHISKLEDKSTYINLRE